MKAEDLRKSILQMAIQGKLVPQNNLDEPASVLLQKIRVEKENLIKEGKIKRDKIDSAIFKGEDGKFYEKTGKEVKDITDQLPFEIPESWTWSRLGIIGVWGAGATPEKSNNAYYANATIPWLVTGDLNDGVIKDIPGRISELALKQTSVRLNPKDSVLIAMYGATIGKLGILSFPATTNQACCACQPFEGIDNWYLFYYLLAQRESFRKRGEGGAQPNISKEKIIATLVPIPPYEEQKRIVEAIEKFEPLIAEYDKLEQQAKKLDGEIFDKLKKSILQYAIRGKLVPQDSSDEPASVLLSKIKAEKEKLIKEGKIKKEKPLSPITDSEKPFDIPDSWQWVRLGELATKFTDGTHSTPKYVLAGVPFLSVKDMSRGFLDFSNTKFISEEEHEILYKRCNPEKGDLLITKVGTTGIPVIVDTDKQFSLFVSVALMKFSKRYLDVNFLKELINSPLVQQQAQENTRGVGNKNWVLDDIRNTIVPLLPLNEQKRIVARIEQLFAEIDKINRQ